MPSVRSKTARYCFVPGCTTGYKNSKNKYALFSIPKNSELRSKWDKMIPRADKSLQDNSAVCEVHFDEQFIERNFRHIINGKEVLIPRTRPVLKKDAIPTVFPNLPKYLSSVPKKRPPPSERNYCINKKVKHQVSEDNANSFNLPDDGVVDVDSLKNLVINLPSQFWTKLQFQNSSTLVFATFNFVHDDSTTQPKIFPNKLVVIKNENKIFCYTVIIGGIVKESNSFKTVSELEVVLQETEKVYECQGIGKLSEFCDVSQHVKNIPAETQIYNDALKAKKCYGTSNSNKASCLPCKVLRKKILNKISKSKRQKNPMKKNVIRNKVSIKHSKLLKQKVCMLKKKFKIMKVRQEIDRKVTMQNNLKFLDPKQQLAISECFKASKRKSTRGMQYQKQWLLECILMRMKSPRLYEYMRLNKILALPSKSCIQKALKNYKAGFGFNNKTFEALKEKVKCLDKFSRHGNLLFDEMKLSENLQLNSDGSIQGYVDYGAFPTDQKQAKLCDHGLVLLFQPFTGEWIQIVGLFATRGNMKGSMLAKILTEAIINTEYTGLYVDAVTGDGATWNRNMWKQFGIGVTPSGNVQCKVIHPCDDSRYLYFISDFPHLLKCLRNTFLRNGGFLTPDGEVRIEFLKTAWKEDSKLIPMKVMPKISKIHFYPNNFEKMRVNYAFQLFSDEVVKGLSFYKESVSQYGDVQPTTTFISRIGTLIKVMTSRTHNEGLYLNSIQEKFLKEFFEYLINWETSCGPQRLGYISQSTSEGLKVTIKSTLEILEYLAKDVKYKYLMTSRLSQDKLENLFSIIRQSKGCNDHPSSSEFLTIVECMSFYNLARTPRGGNTSVNVINSLMDPNQSISKEDTVFAIIDNFIKDGQLSYANEYLQHVSANDDHQSLLHQNSDSRLIYYIAGYVVRKFQKVTCCSECKKLLEANTQTELPNVAKYTTDFDRGGLMYPSLPLYQLISGIEAKITESLSFNELHKETILDVISNIKTSKIELIGCTLHKVTLTQKIVKFFILTRLHFHLKEVNKNRMAKREKTQYLKMRRTR